MFRAWTQKRLLIKAAKIIGWVALSFILLLLLLVGLIQIPAVQNRIVQKTVTELQQKLGTTVSLSRINIKFPKSLVLEDLYMEDQSGDTLLFAGDLSINTDLFALLKNKIQLNDVSIENWHVAISRPQDEEKFNYEFILDAFATEPPAVPDTTQTPWTFDFGLVSFEDVRVSYYDKRLGNEIDANIGKLEVDVEELDLNAPHLWLSSVEFQDSKLVATLSGVAENPEDTTATAAADSTPFAFDLETANLRNITSTIKNIALEQVLHVDVGELDVRAKKIDIVKNDIDVDMIKLSNSFLSLHRTGTPLDSIENNENDEQEENTPWKLRLRSLKLNDNGFQYYDFNAPTTTAGLNFNNLWLRGINIDASNLDYNGSTGRGEIDLLSLNEKSGFAISSFKTEFELTEHELIVDSLQVSTPNSKVLLQANAQFPSSASITETYPEAAVTLKSQSTIGLKDILYFSPALLDSIPLKVNDRTTLTLDTYLTGKVKELKIQQFTASTLSDTRLSMAGNIKGLGGNKAAFHISLDEFFTTGRDLRRILDDSLASKFNLPKQMRLKGKYDGTASTPSVIAQLTTDMGSVELDADMNLTSKGKETYSGKVKLKEFQVGKLLRRDDLGNVEMLVAVEGSGTTMKNLNAHINTTVSKIQYRDYDYQNFELRGSLKNYFFSGEAGLADKNLSFVFSGDLDYTENIVLYKFNFNLKHADLNALHLTERPLKARGQIDVDLATADFRSVNGTLDIRDVAIFNGQTLYAVDSLLFASIDQTGNSKISIRSDIMTGDFEGTINLFDMGNALRRHFNNYYSLRDTTFNRPAEIQKFSFALVLKNTDLLTEILVPKLEPFVPGKIEGEFDSENDELNLSIDLTKIRYGDVGLDSILLNVKSDENSLDYILRLRKVTMDTLGIEALTLSGKAANDSIRTKLTILDSLQKEKYVLGGAFYSLEENTQFRLLEDEVVINHVSWTTPSDNFLRFGKIGIDANNFSITNINESLSFVTHAGENATSVVFKDLNIQNLLNLVEGTILADGLMNANIRIADQGSFKAEVKIESLDIFEATWGDLNLNASGTADGIYKGTFAVEGPRADILVKGEYQQASSSRVKLTATISTLDLALVEPLTAGQLKQMKGDLRGDIRVTGEAKRPQILGGIYFSEASFIPTFVGTQFVLKDEEIAFTNDGVVLKEFEISDQNDNKASLNGSIGTKDYTNFNLDLKLTARNFQLLNTGEDDNELFYGKVSINSDATISGTLTQPKVVMQMNLMDDSEFTYIVPQSEKGVLEQRGIVLFVDKDAKDDPFLASINPRDTVKSRFVGLDLTANVELNDKETLSIIIDPITGDKLTVKGNSTLTLDIDPTGDMQLSGRYEITEGSYDLSFYKLVKRKFSIEKGSTITWSGDPLLATMDITASHEVETSPLDLVINQVPITDQQQTNMYKQRLPFLVYLNIRGDLLTPDISFELDMPVDTRDAMGGSIYAKIKDVNTRESDLNKQVFALLILRRFISDNPFETESGSSVASTARRSVSKLLTEQLNRLSENVKGVELSFDVKSYEDYTSGEAQGQTAVQLGVSKSLLDDRLIVKVSGNVDIEGNATNQNSFTDYIGDLALEYKLTEDGRFRITGFRNNNYDIISGELIETGAGLIYIKDYNTLRELFKANAKKK